MSDISDLMIQKASKAYAKKRHPSRWDGEPWGMAGTENHRRAIRDALKAGLQEMAMQCLSDTGQLQEQITTLQKDKAELQHRLARAEKVIDDIRIDAEDRESMDAESVIEVIANYKALAKHKE